VKATPAALSNNNNDGQNKHVELTTGKQPDALYAKIRRLEVKISDLEAVIAIIRRDVARIDRRGYREAEKPAVPISPLPGQYPLPFDIDDFILKGR